MAKKNTLRLQLADALKEAEAAHHAFEQARGEPDKDWAKWYAEWLVCNADDFDLHIEYYGG